MFSRLSEIGLIVCTFCLVIDRVYHAKCTAKIILTPVEVVAKGNRAGMGERKAACRQKECFPLSLPLPPPRVCGQELKEAHLPSPPLTKPVANSV